MDSKYRIVKIDWIDPLEMRGLSYKDDLDGITLQKCSIVGHLIKETKDAYFVAKEVWENDTFKYIHIIPKNDVESFSILISKKG